MEYGGVASSRSLDLLSIVETRPEAIKIAPLALEAGRRPALRHRILATGQQDALFDDALDGFGLLSDLRLTGVVRDRSPDVMIQRIVSALCPILAVERPDMVLVQGDTTSAYAAALAAHALGIPVAHVEAGLRSHDLSQPWPEERNRIAIDRLATLQFAPTLDAKANLIAERDVVAGNILVTGNTGIDALLTMRANLGPVPPPFGPAQILLTCHWRENFGTGIAAICTAALRLADRGDIAILCPVHSNPIVGDVVRAMLSGHSAIVVTGALPYRETVAAVATARLILTDSGGIQEEAPALGTRTLVLRDFTERPESVAPSLPHRQG